MAEDFLQQRRSRLLELLEEAGAGLHVLFVKLTLREDVAEELMQELFVKLSTSGRLDRVENRIAYARRAAINLAYDWRRKQRHGAVSIDNVGDIPDKADSPLAEVIRREELEDVIDAVGRLNKDSRDSVVMRYIEQRSYDYIAAQLHKTPHHIRAVCHRARQRLRTILGQNESSGSAGEGQDV